VEWTLRADGRLWFRAAQASASNEVILPPLAAGEHEVLLEAPAGVEVFLNRAARGAADVHLERTGSWLGKAGLGYRIEKMSAARESLCVRAYRRAGFGKPIAIRAMVIGVMNEDGTPAESWTFVECVYQVRAANGVAGRLIGSSDALLEGGELFTLTLGADLAPGRCDVVFTLEEGDPCFLQVVHVVPGTTELRRVFSERGDAEGGAEQ
jgi:hypothetical protein